MLIIVQCLPSCLLCLRVASVTAHITEHWRYHYEWGNGEFAGSIVEIFNNFTIQVFEIHLWSLEHYTKYLLYLDNTTRYHRMINNLELKTDFLIYFSPNFSTQMNVSLPVEGHNVAYQCKGLDQSNIVCEYEVNLSTNEMVITEKQNFNTNC